jgi:hypothetical protein
MVRLQPFASSTVAFSPVNELQKHDEDKVRTESNLKSAPISVHLWWYRDLEGILGVRQPREPQDVRASWAYHLQLQIPWAISLIGRIRGARNDAKRQPTHKQLDFNIHHISRAAVDSPLGAGSNRVGDGRGRKGVNNLIDAGPIQWHNFVVGVAEMGKCVLVMTAVGRLQRQLATRRGENLGELSRGFLVSLGVVVHSKRWRPVEDKRCCNAGISGAWKSLMSDQDKERKELYHS